MGDETIVVIRTLTMRMIRGGCEVEMEQGEDGTITIRDESGDFITDIRPEDLARFMDLIRAGGTNGND